MTVPQPMEYETFLGKLSPKDRANAERHVAACEAEGGPDHARLWKRMARLLATLAPHSAKVNAQQSIQFYVADGKYRMQVFALEDLRDGKLTIYCKDVLDDAIRRGLLGKGEPGPDEVRRFPIPRSHDAVAIEQLDGTFANPAVFFKDMLGWNRKAIRIIVPVGASSAQVAAVEAVCALSVEGKGAPVPA